MAEGTRQSEEPGLRTLFEAGAVAGRPDGELLDCFLAAGGPVAEAAFAALVERHGPMVWRVCRDVLRESNDADDAFQATFLILARRAREIRKRSSVKSWLYGAAVRVARCARSGAARRRDRERAAADQEAGKQPVADVDHFDEAPIVHEEVGRLPEKYRSPVVLCYFEGLTHEQAAIRLGWPVGTVRSRLAEARSRLRPRLLRRGVGPSVAVLAAAGRAQASAAAPAALVAAAIRTAIGANAAGTVPAAVAALVGKASREMTAMKLSKIAIGLLVAALVGTAGARYAAVVEQPQEAAKPVAPRPDDPPAKAVEAVRIAAVETKTVTIPERYVARINSARRIEVRAAVEGYLKGVPIKEGQMVKEGDLLYRMEPPFADHAPFDGMIGQLRRQQGSFVLKGEALTTLSDNSMVSVHFNVPETRYLQYMAAHASNREDSKVELFLADGSKFPHVGKVGSIDAEFNPESGTIAFHADFPNPDRLLRDGQYSNVSISREEKDAIVVPQRATFEASGKRYVYVVDEEDVAHGREITVRAEAGDLFVISGGLKAGERIVVEGVGKVEDGKKVEPPSGRSWGAVLDRRN